MRVRRDENSTTYVAGIESSTFFGERIYAEAVVRGIEHARRVVVLSDCGAAYNKTIAQTHFHGALHIIDLYRSSSSLWPQRLDRPPIRLAGVLNCMHGP